MFKMIKEQLINGVVGGAKYATQVVRGDMVDILKDERDLKIGLLAGRDLLSLDFNAVYETVPADALRKTQKL